MVCAQANILAFAEAQKAKGVDVLSRADGRLQNRPDRPAHLQRWLLCSRRPLPSAVNIADDRHSRAGRRSRTHRRLLTQARAGNYGSPPPPCRCHRVLSHRRRTGNRRPGLRHRKRSLAVDKIVGPGNLYVTAAKQLVSTVCGIDMPAGPTEIVVTSETGRTRRHRRRPRRPGRARSRDPRRLHYHQRSSSRSRSGRSKAPGARANPIAKQSIAARGCIFVTKWRYRSSASSPTASPPSTSPSTPSPTSKWVKNAGSVFVGPFAPQAMGDYVSGPNHVLPTGRNGRVRGGLSVHGLRKGHHRPAVHAQRIAKRSAPTRSRWQTLKASRATPQA